MTVGFNYNPYTYNPYFGQTSTLTASKVTPYVGSRVVPYVMNSQQTAPLQIEGDAPEHEEETLTQCLTGGGLFMGAIEGYKIYRHPFVAFDAMKEADAVYRTLLENPNFQKLPVAEQMQAYRNIWNKSRLGGLIEDTTKIPETARTLEDSKKITAELEKAYKEYQAALQSGNATEVARHAKRMETLISDGKKQGFFKRLFSTGNHVFGKEAKIALDADTVIKNATEAGNNVAQAAEAGAAAARTATAEAGSFAKATNWTKQALKSGGFKGMALLEGSIEIFTEVMPAFEQGTDKGVKQLGKSAVTVAGSAAGWCIGYTAGAAIGAKAGAAVGSCICPGVGTVVGAVIGLAGGLIGSWLGRKVAKAVVGPSEREKAEKEAKKQQAMQQQQQQILTAQQALAAQPEAQQPTSNETAIAEQARQILAAQSACALTETPTTTPSFGNSFNYASNPFAYGMSFDNPFDMSFNPMFC